MNLNGLTVKALRSLVSSNSIPNHSSLKKKDDLIRALTSMNLSTAPSLTTQESVIDKSSAKALFFSKCDDKAKNDKYNKMREEILESILDNKYDMFISDEEYGIYWKNLKEQWGTVLQKIYAKPYDSIKIKQKGGRAYNYDFDVSYLKDKQVVDTLKVEFKCGGTIIGEIPQFFNADANKLFLPGYASWFYDNYVTKKEPWTKFEAVSKETYMKEIYKNSSKIPYFNKLYDAEKADKDLYKLKANLTAESIATWLDSNYKNLELEELSKEFIRSQSAKIFVLWDKDTFYVDTFDKDELTVSKIVGIKNKNVILVNSQNSKIQYELLLRWKNHLGVLKPAWQISMKRLAEHAQSQS